MMALVFNKRREKFMEHHKNNEPHSFFHNQQILVKKTEELVRSKLEGEGTGHDWWHVHRVRNMALTLARQEKASAFTVELAALLHDIADWKFQKDGNDDVGPTMAQEFLDSIGVSKEISTHVSEIIKTISFKGAHVHTKVHTKEAEIVQDADRLDALGAIGITRCFAYGGLKNNPIHDPEIKPQLHSSFEEYKQGGKTSVNHFYEKLLLLKDRMNTEAGRRIAQQRHDVMEQFLSRFYKEWDGEL